MFNSPIIEVALGLVLIYLVLGLLCTSINEYIAQLLSLRAENLAEAIHGMFPAKAIGYMKVRTSLPSVVLRYFPQLMVMSFGLVKIILEVRPFQCLAPEAESTITLTWILMRPTFPLAIM